MLRSLFKRVRLGRWISARPVGYRLCEALESRQMLSLSPAVPPIAIASDDLAIHEKLSQSKSKPADAAIAGPARNAASSTSSTRTKTQASPRAQQSAFAKPITITRGGTYSGKWESLDANVPAIRVRTSEPVIIQNSVIRSRGTCIEVYGHAANVTVRNTRGYGLNPNVADRYPGRFLDVEGFVNLVVTNNYMESTSGIYVYDYRGNHTPKQTVKVLRNVARNIDGRVSNGNGGWMPGSPNPEYYKQFFQINGVKNLAGAEIAWNQIINLPGQSRVEENINIHATTGRRNSPILVHDNYIQGAYAADELDAQTYTGGGIMLSDNGSSYIRAYRNHIVSTGHIGITVTSGHDNAFYNNRIISSGRHPDGSVISYSNVGSAIWNYNNEPTFKNNTGYNNLIGWVNATGERNDAWTPDAGKWTNNKTWPGVVTKATEAAEWQIWRQKLSKAKIKVGPVTK